MSEEEEASAGRYVVVKALEDGVTIMGLTRGKDTRSHHSERLDEGEVLVAQFTELTAAIKIRGKAEILTDVGKGEAGSEGSTGNPAAFQASKQPMTSVELTRSLSWSDAAPRRV